MSSACVEAKRCHGDVTVIPHSPEKASADRSELVGRRRHSDRHDRPPPDQQESRGIGKRREGDDGIEDMATTRGVHGMNDTSVHEFSGHRGGDKHHERRHAHVHQHMAVSRTIATTTPQPRATSRNVPH